jgi:hypothetical protein
MEWISVEDRLPVDRGDHFAKYITMEVLVYDGHRVYVDTFIAGNTIEYWSKFESLVVTHWMPLPSPPEA